MSRGFPGSFFAVCHFKQSFCKSLILSLAVHGALFLIPATSWRDSVRTRPELRADFRPLPPVATEIRDPARSVALPAESRSPAESADGSGSGAIRDRAGIPAVRYLPNREVDVPAAPIDLVPLVIPQTEYLNRITGKVVVRVFIGPAGSVDQTEIVSSSPPGSYDAAAISAVTGTRFSPALVAGKPVGNVKLLVIDIDPYESGDEGKR